MQESYNFLKNYIRLSLRKIIIFGINNKSSKNMKAKTIILCAFVLFGCPLRQQAQSFTPGITVGVSTTSVNMSAIPNAAINSVKGNNILGFEGGFLGRFNFGPVFIKPMVLVSYQYGTVNFNNTDGTVNSPNFDYGTVEVPLLFGIRFFKFLRID